MPSALARELSLSIRGNPVNLRTPLLVPSFSSKALLDIGKVLDATQNSITGSLLISAYDIFHKYIQPPVFPFAEVVFLDSGGYEISKDYDILDPRYPSRVSEPESWDNDSYRTVLSNYTPVMPTIAACYDHPTVRTGLPTQIDSALELFKDYPDLGRALLLKPETNDQTLLNIRSVVAQVQRFNEFDVIGMAETELGNSLLDRMVKIAKLRAAMDAENIVRPIHIFGSLDPVCTPLYFLAGADIFDGLSWIRFSFLDDMAVYHRNRAPLDFGLMELDRRALARSYESNLHYLADLNNRMHRYLLDRDESRLGRHATFFKNAIDDVRVRLKGVM